MSETDRVYYLRRDEEERAQVARAETADAKAAHQQLCNPFLGRAGRPLKAADVMVRAGDDG